MSSTGLRGHELKLYKPQAHLDIRNFFTVRVIDEWNKLPESLLHCGTLSTFNKNSSGDEIANVNFLTTISHTRRPTSKYRKRDKPDSFNKLNDS